MKIFQRLVVYTMLFGSSCSIRFDTVLPYRRSITGGLNPCLHEKIDVKIVLMNGDDVAIIFIQVHTSTSFLKIIFIKCWYCFFCRRRNLTREESLSLDRYLACVLAVHLRATEDEDSLLKISPDIFLPRIGRRQHMVTILDQHHRRMIILSQRVMISLDQHHRRMIILSQRVMISLDQHHRRMIILSQLVMTSLGQRHHIMIIPSQLVMTSLGQRHRRMINPDLHHTQRHQVQHSVQACCCHKRQQWGRL